MKTQSSRFSLGFLVETLFKALSSKLQRVYFQTVEHAGHHKRDILVTRVELARDSLEEAKDQFQNALDRFSQLTAFEGGSLESTYRQLKVEYDYSQSRATLVAERIEAIERVAKALFREWDEELTLYTNRTLRGQSRQKLKATQQHYQQLIQAMRKAEAKMDPVLRIFQDQVLYLKHNLNAKAIASLEGELRTLSAGVSGLIGAMEQSIRRANLFVESMSGEGNRSPDQIPKGPDNPT